jgi:glycolate oxidase iron-sulfur subunit
LFLDCVHCGLCQQSCPTYVELGTEMDSPRGRIYLMRAVTDGRLELDSNVRRHLDLCLGCRSCETACPSGVQYGKLIEPFRVLMARTGGQGNNLSIVQQFLLFHLLPYAWRARLALAPVRLMQWSRLHRGLERCGALNWLPAKFRRMYEMLPVLRRRYGRLPEVLPAQGKRRARVALFTGCIADAIFPQTTLAAARVLQHNGCEVWIPRKQGCCGALHYHAGYDEPAREFARANCGAFGFLSQEYRDDLDAVIVNAAGCGAMLKDYGHLLKGTAEAHKLAAKVRDISEFLMELGPVQPKHALPITATYHDACHLCHVQHVRSQPRQLLEMVPRLVLVPLAESELCCGAAGSYNLSQPEMAEELGRRKIENIAATKADAVFAGNVGCLMQIKRHLRGQPRPLWVAHPIDALWASYSGQTRE